jgi:hypothetical protein
MQRYEKNKNYYNVPRFAKISKNDKQKTEKSLLAFLAKKS